MIGSLRSLSVLLAAPLPAREFQMTPQDLLRLHPFFSALPPTDIDKLLMRTRRRRVLAGKVLFEKDAPGDGLYGVLSGRVAFTVDSAGGKELTLNVLGPGEFFGEIALLDGKGRSAAATARDACELLFIPRSDFLSFSASGRRRCSTSWRWSARACGAPRNTSLTRPSSIWRGGWPSSLLSCSTAWRLPQAGLRISHAELASMLGGRGSA